MGIDKIHQDPGASSGISQGAAGALAPATSPAPIASDARSGLWRRLADSVGARSLLSALFRPGAEPHVGRPDPLVPPALPALATPVVAPYPPDVPPPAPPKPKLDRGKIEAKLLAGESLDGFDLTGIDLRLLDFSNVHEFGEAILDKAFLDRETLSVLLANRARVNRFGWHALDRVNLVRAKLAGLILDYCSFIGADFTGADLRGASVEGTIFTGADLQWTKLDARVIQIIKEGKTRLGQDGLHDFRLVNFSDEDLMGADLLDLDLRSASFERAGLNGADLTRTRLDRLSLWQIFEGGSRRDASGSHDFHFVNLQDISLVGFPSLELLDLGGANLNGVLLDKDSLKALIVGNSRLQDDGFHDFRGVRLNDVDLRAIDLQNLDLKGADLRGAVLGRKEVEGIILSGTRKNPETGLHELQGVKLAEVDLTGLDLSSVNLAGALLTGALLDRRSVVGLMTNGSRFDNGYHDLKGVNLVGVDLRGIDLSDVDLKGANLDGALIDREQIVARIFYRLYCQPGESAGHEIWDDIENLMPFLSPSDLFQVATLIPDVDINLRQLNNRLVQIAILVTKVMDGVEFGAFRKVIHQQPVDTHRATIASYLALAKTGRTSDEKVLKQEEQLEMMALLSEAEELASRIGEDHQTMRHSRDVANELKDLGILYAGERDYLTPARFIDSVLRIREKMTSPDTDVLGRIRLARVLKALDSYAFREFAPAGSSEVGSATQAKKIGALILLLYGCGYGDRAWAETGVRLLAVSKTGDESLYRYSVLAYQFIEEVEDAYHGMFDSVLARYREDWQVDPAVEREFSRSIYRLGGLFQLGLHLPGLNIRPGGRNTIERVLDILGRAPLGDPIPYRAYFFDENGIDDVRILGGKGRGLRRLTKNRDEGGYKVPAGFTLPPIGGDFTAEKKQVIINALARLEEKTGRSFADGSLKVSVRSGACVSMPGMMSTELNVASLAAVMDAVERVYASWNSPRAFSFRRLNGIPDDWGTSVSIVEMVDGEKNDESGAGVVTSKSPDGIQRDIQYSYGRRILGEEIVANRHRGDDPLPEGMENRLRKVIKFWERELNYPVELEFTVESGELYLLQIRRARLEYEDEIRWVHSMVHHERMTKQDGINYLGGVRRLQQAGKKVEVDLKDEKPFVVVDSRGTGNPWSGRIILHRDQSGEFLAGGRFVYVSDDPDAGSSYEALLLTGAVVATGGNPLSHLAVVARGQGMSYMANAPVKVDASKRHVSIGKTNLQVGDWITMDPTQGRIFQGELPIREGVSEVDPLINNLLISEGNRPSESPKPRRVGLAQTPFFRFRAPSSALSARGLRGLSPVKSLLR